MSPALKSFSTAKNPPMIFSNQLSSNKSPKDEPSNTKDSQQVRLRMNLQSTRRCNQKWLYLPIEWPTNATVTMHALDLSLYIGCGGASIRSIELKWDCDSISDGIKRTSHWLFGTVFVRTPPTVRSRFHQTQSVSTNSLVVFTAQSSIIYLSARRAGQVDKKNRIFYTQLLLESNLISSVSNIRIIFPDSCNLSGNSNHRFDFNPITWLPNLLLRNKNQISNTN